MSKLVPTPPSCYEEVMSTFANSDTSIDNLIIDDETNQNFLKAISDSIEKIKQNPETVLDINSAELEKRPYVLFSEHFLKCILNDYLEYASTDPPQPRFPNHIINSIMTNYSLEYYSKKFIDSRKLKNLTANNFIKTATDFHVKATPILQTAGRVKRRYYRHKSRRRNGY